MTYWKKLDKYLFYLKTNSIFVSKQIKNNFMKKILLLLPIASIFLNSCGDSTNFSSTSGKVLVEVGQIKDSISFLNTDSTLTSEADIKSLIDQTAFEGQLNIKNPLTFKPLDCMIYSENDTTTVNLSFSAENSFGVPGELTASCLFVNKRIIKDQTLVIEK